MFVDDVQIGYSHHDVGELQRVMQGGARKIAKWARENGFTFSKSKTVMMQFYKTRAPVLKPKIYLDNNLIPEVDTFKFLGLMWDPKLTWIPHIAQLKDRCMKNEPSKNSDITVLGSRHGNRYAII